MLQSNLSNLADDLIWFWDLVIDETPEMDIKLQLSLCDADYVADEITTLIRLREDTPYLNAEQRDTADALIERLKAHYKLISDHAYAQDSTPTLYDLEKAKGTLRTYYRQEFTGEEPDFSDPASIRVALCVTPDTRHVAEVYADLTAPSLRLYIDGRPQQEAEYENLSGLLDHLMETNPQQLISEFSQPIRPFIHHFYVIEDRRKACLETHNFPSLDEALKYYQLLPGEWHKVLGICSNDRNGDSIDLLRCYGGTHYLLQERELIAAWWNEEVYAVLERLSKDFPDCRKSVPAVACR